MLGRSSTCSGRRPRILCRRPRAGVIVDVSGAGRSTSSGVRSPARTSGRRPAHPSGGRRRRPAVDIRGDVSRGGTLERTAVDGSCIADGVDREGRSNRLSMYWGRTCYARSAVSEDEIRLQEVVGYLGRRADTWRRVVLVRNMIAVERAARPARTGPVSGRTRMLARPRISGTSRGEHVGEMAGPQRLRVSGHSVHRSPVRASALSRPEPSRRSRPIHGDQTPSERPMISFMISVVPP